MSPTKKSGKLAISGQAQANKIRKILKSLYPNVKTRLRYETSFQLLIATILSAQCTDKQVNAVTPKLFKKYKTPADFAETEIQKIEKAIHSTGFYHNKARNIKACSKMLIEQYKGEVPARLEDLVKLPGVGRKTANVVLGAAFGIPGVVVDTHVARISNRLGLTPHKVPDKIESELMALVPKKEWNDFSLRLIYFGRAICNARKPKCPDCPLLSICLYEDKTKKKSGAD